MPAPGAVVTTESPAAPVLLSIYTDHGPAGRVELSPLAALGLALDLLASTTPKLATRLLATTDRIPKM